MPRMKVELNWGPQYGGWIKGTVMEKADPGEELVQMHGQVPTSVAIAMLTSTLLLLWQAMFET
jgi:hypothetical protein